MLHACCGPCLLEPFDALVPDHEVAVCYANPNIHPAKEYERRRDTMMEWMALQGLDAVELPYEPGAWRRAVDGAGSRPERCRRCFALRLGLVARAAADRGFEAIATTLSVSPYADPAAIEEAGRGACAGTAVRWLGRDFRERYPQATRRSRELGMYRQNYCGCLPSIGEAEADRALRRAVRRSDG